MLESSPLLVARILSERCKVRDLKGKVGTCLDHRIHKLSDDVKILVRICRGGFRITCCQILIWNSWCRNCWPLGYIHKNQGAFQVSLLTESYCSGRPVSFNFDSKIV